MPHLHRTNLASSREAHLLSAVVSGVRTTEYNYTVQQYNLEVL